MGVRFPSVFTNTFIGPLPANATETVIATTPPLTITLDFAQVLLFWACSFSVVGASVTSHSFRIRRGTTAAGTVVFVATFANNATAGGFSTTSGVYADTPGAVAGQQYSLTVAQNAATGAGTINDLALIAMTL